MTTVIAMWSGPRNLSTAMMRSFGARPDCAILDEPFFAPYLKVTGKEHPGRQETLAVHETDLSRIAEFCGASKTDKCYSFQKHMPHHMLPEFPMDWAKSAKHFFLIRQPARVIASYAKGRAEFDLEDLGFAPQRRLFDALTQMTGTTPPVISCDDVLESPEVTLNALCEAIDIPFSETMLSWKKGPRAEDGAWAPFWYASVRDSTGFGLPPSALPTLSGRLEAFETLCQSDYEHLLAHKISH